MNGERWEVQPAEVGAPLTVVQAMARLCRADTPESAAEQVCAAIAGLRPTVGVQIFVQGQLFASAGPTGRSRRPELPTPAADSGMSSLVQVVADSGGEPWTAAEQVALAAAKQSLTVRLEWLSTRRASDSLTALQWFSSVQRAISARTELAQILSLIAEGAGQVLNSEVSVVHLCSPSAVATHGVPQAEAELLRAGDLSAAGVAAMRGSAPVAVDDFSRTREDRRYGEPGIRKLLAVPLQRGPRSLGYLLVASRRQHRCFGAADVTLASAVADMTVLAAQDATVVKQLHSALNDAMFRASHDDLTQLANRAHVTQLIGATLERDRPHMGVLYVDIDWFKTINDTYGHRCGDELLRVVAKRLKSCVRGHDVVSRLGGDEFLIMAAQVPELDVMHRLAERVMARVCTPVVLPGGVEVTPSVSVGAAVAQCGDTVDELVARADLALYAAKRAGRGQVQYATEGRIVRSNPA